MRFSHSRSSSRTRRHSSRHSAERFPCFSAFRAAVALALWCYWDNENGDRVPDVPADIRAMMDAMGGTVEIDEYR